jgi:hypothetical protein
LNLVNAAEQLRIKTPGLFLFTHRANLVSNSDPFSARFLNGAGKEVTLDE